MIRAGCFCLIMVSQILLQSSVAADPKPWLVPEEGRPFWGHRDGLVFTLWPGSFSGVGHGGPRGLIRVGFMHQGQPQMLNFIAIEPIVKGVRCYSELEPSELDKVPGKRFWPFPPIAKPELSPGEPRPRSGCAKIRQTGDGGEVLEVGIGAEPFVNGAKVYLIARMDSRHPHELVLRMHAAPGSAAMERCILSATMGNYIRARRLWLGKQIVESTRLFARYQGTAFTDPAEFGREDLLRQDGYLWAAITTDEADPASVFPFAPDKAWHYPGPPVTQYWRTRDDHPDEPCRIRVNGRYTYWCSERPVPGGIAYENFEFDRPFHEGQSFIFGISPQPSPPLGFPKSGEK